MDFVTSGIQDCSDMHSWGLGARTCFVIHYIIRGKGTFIRNGKKFAVSAGESFVIRPFEKVRYYPDENDPWKYVWIDFNGKQFSSLLQNISYRKEDCIIGAVKKAEILPLFGVLRSIIRTEPNGKAAAGAALAILGTYCDRFPLTQISSADSTALLAEALIKSDFYKPDFNVSAVCSALGVSRATLHRCFKKHFGTAAGEYLQNYRLERAKEFLKLGQTVKSTAFSCGFSDPLYFSKFFKSATGQPPSEYADG